MGFMKALKKEKILFRLNRRSNMHMKCMGKLVVVVKFQFLVTLHYDRFTKKTGPIPLIPVILCLRYNEIIVCHLCDAVFVFIRVTFFGAILQKFVI